VWPLDVEVQPRANNPRRIGILLPNQPNDPIGGIRVKIMIQSLGALGWSEGSELHIDWRWAGATLISLNAMPPN
jgi:hypothetical protein